MFFEEEFDIFCFDVKGYVDWGVVIGLFVGVVYFDCFKFKDNNGVYLIVFLYFGNVFIFEVLGVMNFNFIGIDGVLVYDLLGFFESGYYDESDVSCV